MYEKRTNPLGRLFTTLSGWKLRAVAPHSKASSVEFGNGVKLGAMVPLDFLSGPKYDAWRYGAVFYGQYDMQDGKGWEFKPTVFGEYIRTERGMGYVFNVAVQALN